MDLSKTQLAVLNNIRWYEAIFAAHGLSYTVDEMVWLSREIPPPFHSNLVVLAASISQTDIEAEWIWRDPLPSRAREASANLVWAPVATGAELAEWEGAWSGDARNKPGARVTRQFPDRLLASTEHAFFAGRLDGKIVAGGIANRSPEVVGLSNLFSPTAFAEENWNALVSCASAAFPNTPLVGYERGADLQRSMNAGFASIGPLRVWRRSK